jgi:aminoglycoside 6'-N-acetyltransferase
MAISVLTGERVTLCPLLEEDLPRVLKTLLQPAVSEWWPDYTLQRLRADTFGSPETTSFVIEADGGFAGIILATEQTDAHYKSANMDIALDAAWQGKGLGRDALRTLARHLFGACGHHRLTIDPAFANERAISTYLAIGFKPVGIMRDYELGPDGEWHDNLLMDMLASELR